MYQAAIVEDDPMVMTYLKNALTQTFDSQSVPVGFDLFSSGEDFLRMFQEHYHYDVIFLDIEMPGIDGIEVCRRMRQIAPNSLVVFVSNREELVYQTFEVQPFRFVPKSQFKTALPALTAAVAEHWRREAGEMLHLREDTSGDLYSFSLARLLYIEAQRKKCRIVTTDGDFLFQYRLMDLERQLAGRSFIKIHRSYLVNCRHIFYIGKASVHLIDGTELPISRGKAETVKQLFLAYSTSF